MYSFIYRLALICCISSFLFFCFVFVSLFCLYLCLFLSFRTLFYYLIFLFLFFVDRIYKGERHFVITPYPFEICLASIFYSSYIQADCYLNTVVVNVLSSSLPVVFVVKMPFIGMALASLNILWYVSSFFLGSLAGSMTWWGTSISMRLLYLIPRKPLRSIQLMKAALLPCFHFLFVFLISVVLSLGFIATKDYVLALKLLVSSPGGLEDKLFCCLFTHHQQPPAFYAIFINCIHSRHRRRCAFRPRLFFTLLSFYCLWAGFLTQDIMLLMSFL